MPDETWRPIQGPRTLNGDLTQAIATVDSLQRAWSDVVAQSSPAEFRQARARSLRRHAIETGIIERLYDVDWGVTRALVAEGLSAEVAAREGGIDEGALETIRAQFEALEMLAETASAPAELDSDITLFLIRQLHTVICRTQATYEALDQFGRLVRSPLHHGSWKTLRNEVTRDDGSVLAFCPPEHVESEVQRLIDLYRESVDLHPLIRAAWLHHAFVTIHPFEDGNGRVARALALLVLLRRHYAPLVVDRNSRVDYIGALNAANSGDLRPLTRLFARLEMVALRAELERPALPAAAGADAVGVATAYAARLRALRGENTTEQRAQGVRVFADQLLPKIVSYLDEVGKNLDDALRDADATTYHTVDSAAPGDDRSTWWRAQIIRAAKEADFYANIGGGTWWTNLRLTVLSQRLRYIVVVQKVGHGETGVLALTVFAETVTDQPSADLPTPQPAFTSLLKTPEAESVTFVYTDEVDQRWGEVREVIDRTLATTMAAFASGLT